MSKFSRNPLEHAVPEPAEQTGIGRPERLQLFLYGRRRPWRRTSSWPLEVLDPQMTQKEEVDLVSYGGKTTSRGSRTRPTYRPWSRSQRTWGKPCPPHRRRSLKSLKSRLMVPILSQIAKQCTSKSRTPRTVREAMFRGGVSGSQDQ